MQLTPGDRAAVDRHIAEIRRILRWPRYRAYQVRLNFNDEKLSSLDYKIHEQLKACSESTQGEQSA
jgi:hypothetical protein